MYSDADIYDVTLKVVSDFGCLDSITKSLEIFYIPDAQFEFNPHTPSILNPEVNFNNTTTDVSSFLWNFDDGTDTTIENPIHVFSDPGMYDVMITVMDDNSGRTKVQIDTHRFLKVRFGDATLGQGDHQSS